MCGNGVPTARNQGNAEMPLESGTRLGSYEVLSLLGAGGMGEVYRARDLELRRDVALKVLPARSPPIRSASRVCGAKREMLAALNHPHVAQIYGIAGDADVRALVLELVEARRWPIASVASGTRALR